MLFFHLAATPQQLQKELKRISNMTDLFLLEEEFSNANKAELNPVVKRLYLTEIATLLRQDEKALNQTDTLLIKYKDSLSSGLTAQLISDNAFLLSQNGKNGQAADYIESKLSLVTDHSDSLNLTTKIKGYNELRATPVPEIRRPPKTTIIRYTLRKTPKGHHYLVPVRIKNKTYSFIFDICGGNTAISVTEKMIKEMGIKIINSGAVYGGSGSTSCFNATIDSIMVGTIVFRNPLLHVNIVADSSQISGVLGNDFMRLVGSLSIYPKRHIIAFPPKIESSHKGHNMMYGSGLYFVNAQSKKEHILFTLDSGASASLILAFYYNQHKEWFDQHAVKDTATIEEGGRKRVEDYLSVNSFPVTVGKSTVVIKKIYVFPNMYWNAFGDQQAVLGTSFFDCFHRVSINFKDMYVSFRK